MREGRRLGARRGEAGRLWCPARALAAVGCWDARARGGPAFGALGVETASGRGCHGGPRAEPDSGGGLPVRGAPMRFGEGVRGRRRGVGPRWEKPELVDLTVFSEFERLSPPPLSRLGGGFVVPEISGKKDVQ